MPSGEDPSGGSGVLTTAGRNPCRTHPPPTSSLGEAPLLGSVQPRSAARNFAIYEQGGRVPLALAASVLALPLSWGEQGRQKIVDPGGGGDPPAKAVQSGVSGPAGSSPLPLRRCPGERSRQPRASQPRRRGSPAVLAGPAECHKRRSKRKGPAEGEAGGPTAHDPRRCPGKGGGHRVATQRQAGPPLGSDADDAQSSDDSVQQRWEGLLTGVTPGRPTSLVSA